MNISLTCLIGLLLVPQSAQKPSPSLEDSLRETFSSVAFPLIVDLPYTRTKEGKAVANAFGPDIKLPAKVSEASLSRFADMIGRRSFAKEGGFLLARKKRAASLSSNRTSDWMNWLSLIDDQQLAQLATSPISYESLDEKGKALVVQACSNMPGIVDRILKGKDVKVRLGYVFEAAAPNASAEQGGSLLLYDELYSTIDWGAEDTVAVDPGQAISGPEDGELKFKEGKLTTYRGLMAEASKAFNARIWADDRLNDIPVFAMGSFTKERFVQLISCLYEVELPQVIDSSSLDKQYSQSDEILRKLAGLGGNDELAKLKQQCLKGALDISSNELAKLFPDAFNRMGNKWPSNTMLKVSARLVVRVEGPGAHTFSNGNNPMMNSTNIGITPRRSTK